MRKATVNRKHEILMHREHVFSFNNRRNRMLMRAIVLDRFSSERWFIPVLKGVIYPVRLQGEALRLWEDAVNARK